MSEIQNTYQWKIGPTTLNKAMDDLDKVYKVALLIKNAEEKHANLIAYGSGEITHFFPELRAKSMRQAGITLAAHARLVKYFNHMISEISL